MKRPLWFHRHGLHWIPCAWQGWLAIGMFVLLLTLAAFRWAAPKPSSFVTASMVLAALMLGAAALTDDTH